MFVINVIELDMYSQKGAICNKSVDIYQHTGIR